METPPSKSNADSPQVARRIGFSGHRHLKHPAKLAVALAGRFAALRKAGTPVQAISSVAIGGDMIFAQEALRAGIEWTALLPLPRDSFRSDFSAEEWAQAEELLAQASEIRTFPGTERPHAYLDCGKAMVDESDWLFAIWNGEAAQGIGGTADIIDYAKEKRRDIHCFRETANGITEIDLSPGVEVVAKKSSRSEPTVRDSAEVSSPETKKRRILALDGGGVRGAISVEILIRMEQLLREHYGKPDYRLCDHFDFFAGTSAGAILAAFLSWGESAASLKKIYLERMRDMFSRAPLKEWVAGRYRAEGMAKFLQSYFSEDDAAKSPALLGTARLKTLLLIVLRNASKGSAWPLTNNPNAKFNRQPLLDNGTRNPECNLNLPLWQLVRASTAAPWYFPPETIQVGVGKRYQFIDGGITPYNNPALIAFLMATLPSYCLGWPAGVEKLRVVSIGTGRYRSAINPRLRDNFGLVRHLKAVPGGLMETIGLQQDQLCRVLGQCEFGGELDSEIGDLLDSGVLSPAERKFAYIRYDKSFSRPEIRQLEKLHKCSFELDEMRLTPSLQEIGRIYALENVRLEHLL